MSLPSLNAAQSHGPCRYTRLKRRNLPLRSGVLQRYAAPSTEMVISGHGEYNEKYLETIGRKKIPVFLMPSGMKITFYAPHGAALENDVANAIEEGNYPNKDEVEYLPKSGGRAKAVPEPYPKVCKSGEEVINYTVAPPGKLTLKGKPYTVADKTSLKDVVADLESQGYTDLHYACCGSAYTDNNSLKDKFPGYGYYVRMKWPNEKQES